MWALGNNGKQEFACRLTGGLIAGHSVGCDVGLGVLEFVFDVQILVVSQQLRDAEASGGCS